MLTELVLALRQVRQAAFGADRLSVPGFRNASSVPEQIEAFREYDNSRGAVRSAADSQALLSLRQLH